MKIHFIGIGGIGMSALAQFFLHEGSIVTGSDTAPSPVTELLEKKGVKIFYEQKAGNISPDLDLVIYTIAIEEQNPELKEAREKKIKMLTYPEALGQISKDKFTIAISGSHGKTTVTAMTAKVLSDNGLKPTVIAGSLMSEYGSNFLYGESGYFVTEACEHKKSFLNLQPNILVITNIDNDHLDYYGDLEKVQEAFTELARKLKPEDFLVCNIEDPNLVPVLEDSQVECNIIDYHSLSADFHLKTPGKHNEENAKAAFAVAAILEVKPKLALEALNNFDGTWRRFERKGITKNGAIIYDDYAHHPTEIRASVAAFKKMFSERKLVVIFQPHLYSRTKLLLKEFGPSFKGADEVIVAPIYAAREKEDKKINSEILSKEIEKNGIKSKSLKNFEEIESYAQTSFNSSHIIVTMGAGDIYKVGESIIQ